MWPTGKARKAHAARVREAEERLKAAEEQLNTVNSDDSVVKELSAKLREIKQRNGLGSLIMDVYRGAR